MYTHTYMYIVYLNICWNASVCTLANLVCDARRPCKQIPIQCNFATLAKCYLNPHCQH